MVEVSGPWRTALFAAYWNVVRNRRVHTKLIDDPEEESIPERQLNRQHTQGPGDEDSGASRYTDEESEEWSGNMNEEESSGLINEKSERMGGKGINEHSGETIDNEGGEKGENLTNKAVAGGRFAPW